MAQLDGNVAEYSAASAGLHPGDGDGDVPGDWL